ncbi:hypothetical protein HMPREF1448_00905 [Helicobacter pylori HP260AFi]|uniref:CagY like domain protein n=1 Tax=Helicobacter pylori HP260AFii TaxID=1159077 RepID=A0ABC9S922_HELPX|nr:hypothetical protein HMPREF1416_00771 [Helicobacter pylori GAM260ASi]EMH29134.1 hypothetical protein HMPREF1422_01042 [Helicobacter pylori GAM268Bii]EMH62990.1 hypothetical protein HMPREF1448_00905 [Helicobacter pylori HP260AFi]EMH66072.1 hypothetical protein HMPREF1450_01238 [Helicobacter pylori HP260ASii]EMH66334.1 hypothetical protein HMPREF1449_01018 [Helicobacter pylori HP260AFii]
MQAIKKQLDETTPYQKRNSPIRDFPKIPPTLFKISLEKLSLG